MFLHGIKSEEYREIKDYWLRRLVESDDDVEMNVWQQFVDEIQDPCRNHNSLHELMLHYGFSFKKFTHVVFSNGYSKNAPKIKFQLEEITIGNANPDWSDGAKGFFLILKVKK